jgi:hypothetical protein
MKRRSQQNSKEIQAARHKWYIAKDEGPTEAARHNHAPTLEENVFTWHDPIKIAQSLQAAAEHSRSRRKDPYRATMLLLTTYIDQNGSELSESQLQTLEAAKEELKQLFRKP